MVTDDKLMEMFQVEELEQRLEMKAKATANVSYNQQTGTTVSAGVSWEF